MSDWIPISYFGDYAQSNAWVLSINPSDWEFLDHRKKPLTGNSQRFKRLADFPGIEKREQLQPGHVQDILSYQDTIFERVPYRPFFNRLGRFLSMFHGIEPSGDPLVPFTHGVAAHDGNQYRYAHLDVVKCATARPWGQLFSSERNELVQNCSTHLERQIRTHPGLDLVLINGRTAFERCLGVLKQAFGFDPVQRSLDLDGRSCQVWTGFLCPGDGQETRVVGWSANVVNQQLRTVEVQRLVSGLQQVLLPVTSGR